MPDSETHAQRQHSGAESLEEFDSIGISADQRIDSYRNSKPRSQRGIIRLVLWSVSGLLLVVAVVFVSQFLRWQSWSSNEVREQFGDHPLVVEHFGEIVGCRFSFSESASPDAPESDLLAFRVIGSRNNGFIYVKSSSDSFANADWAGMRIDEQFWPLENQ